MMDDPPVPPDVRVKATLSLMAQAIDEQVTIATNTAALLRQMNELLLSQPGPSKSPHGMSELEKKLRVQRNKEDLEQLRMLEVELERGRRKTQEALETTEMKQMEETERSSRECSFQTEVRTTKSNESRNPETDRHDEAEKSLIEMEKIAVCEANEEEEAIIEEMEQVQELAFRLAQEYNSQVEALPTSVLPILAPGLKRKYDLSKWKYSELRDTINTSCDYEQLEACREEFHRRLKVYHAWKAKNKKKSSAGESERAPKSIFDNAGTVNRRSLQATSLTDKSKQRFFRIPFVRPHANGETPEGKKGWWYAHFDGQYVARQMELHSDKQAILLVAGVDDMHMCELSLEETGLATKKGAEILEVEFNREWEKWGGKPFIPSTERAK